MHVGFACQPESSRLRVHWCFHSAEQHPEPLTYSEMSSMLPVPQLVKANIPFIVNVTGGEDNRAIRRLADQEYLTFQ
jgi:hypothetical protein